MQLKLSRPLVVFDIEATGMRLGTDRIVEISMIKIMPDGSTESYTQRVKPEIPIPPFISDIIGIKDQDLMNEPIFEEVAPKIQDFIDGCDLAGYNSNRFDVPMLAEEFLRTGFSFDENRKYVDVLRIFTLMEKRNLGAAYKFFCNKELENAHTAEADTIATMEVLKAQIERYDELENDIDFLHNFTKDDNFVDFGRRMVYVDEVEHFNFGKHKGKPVEEVLKKEPQYYDWMMRGDFAGHTKLKLKFIKLRMQNR